MRRILHRFSCSSCCSQCCFRPPCRCRHGRSSAGPPSPWPSRLYSPFSCITLAVSTQREFSDTGYFPCSFLCRHLPFIEGSRERHRRQRPHFPCCLRVTAVGIQLVCRLRRRRVGESRVISLHRERSRLSAERRRPHILELRSPDHARHGRPCAIQASSANPNGPRGRHWRAICRRVSSSPGFLLRRTQEEISGILEERRS
jgi:hypothetical protein